MVESILVLDTSEINEALVSSISRTLQENQIPCLLWGNWMLTVYGVPSIVESIDFVVPDELLSHATSVLSQAGLLHCANTKSCAIVSNERASPPPSVHFHIDSEFVVGLYLKSSTLWFLPSLSPPATPSRLPADIISASDRRLPQRRHGRGHGRFDKSVYPVYMPSAERLLEAYIRLMARDDGCRLDFFWMQMLTYIEEYVDGDGFLDMKSMDERCRVFYERLKTGHAPVIKLIHELKVDLGIGQITER